MRATPVFSPTKNGTVWPVAQSVCAGSWYVAGRRASRASMCRLGSVATQTWV